MYPLATRAAGWPELLAVGPQVKDLCSPQCQETDLSWKGPGGFPFVQPDPPSRNMESSWRRLSYGQALCTSNFSQKNCSQKYCSSAPCGKQLLLNHLQLTQTSCENAWQKLQHGVSYVNRKQRGCTYIFLHV